MNDLEALFKKGKEKFENKGTVMHTYNSSTQEAEVGKGRRIIVCEVSLIYIVIYRPARAIQTLSQNKQKQNHTPCLTSFLST